MFENIFGVASLATLTILVNGLAVICLLIVGICIAAGIVSNSMSGRTILLAKTCDRYCLWFGVIVQLVEIIFFYGLEDYWPRLLTNDETIIAIIKSATPVISICVIPDALQNIFGRSEKGGIQSGFQRKSQLIANLLAYVIGLIIGVTLAYYFQFRVFGKSWIGLESSIFSALVQSTIYFSINWDTAVKESNKRAMQEKFATSVEIELAG